jgi:hypothetical protein
MRKFLWIAVFVAFVVIGLRLRLWVSDLDISAPRTTLHMGQTVQLKVARKTWLGTAPLEHPERTKYITNWESMAVVEPDGKVTAVGTWGKPEETTEVMAFNGRLRGEVNFSIIAGGPGPTLDFTADAPPVPEMGTTTCCSTPVRLVEGRQVRFRVQRRNNQHSDVTPRSTGTRYTLFFGSGLPNDPNPADIVGYGQGISPATFIVDDEHGVITAPASIGHVNHFTVLVFARNGDAVGWKQFQLAHAASQGTP